MKRVYTEAEAKTKIRQTLNNPPEQQVQAVFEAAFDYDPRLGGYVHEDLTELAGIVAAR